MKLNTLFKKLFVVIALGGFCVPAQAMRQTYKNEMIAGALVGSLCGCEIDDKTLSGFVIGGLVGGALMAIKNNVKFNNYPVASIGVLVPFIAYGACEIYDEVEAMFNYKSALVESIEDNNWSKVSFLLGRHFNGSKETNIHSYHGLWSSIHYKNWAADALKDLLDHGAGLDLGYRESILYRVVVDTTKEKVLEVILNYCAENNVAWPDDSKKAFFDTHWYVNKHAKRVLLLQHGLQFEESDIEKLEKVKPDWWHCKYSDEANECCTRLTYLLGATIQDINTRKYCKNNFQDKVISFVNNKKLVDAHVRFK